jgi:tetratricopeptide (TPR) repeat protein
VRLGTYYFTDGKLQEAATEFQKGAALDPQNAIAYYDLGLARTQLGQLDEAQKDIEKVLAIQPDPDAYLALGDLYELQGQFDEAVEVDQKSIALRPGDYQVWGNLGSAYLWAGRHEDSIRAYRKAIELGEAQRVNSPDDTRLLVQLGDYYASSGQPERSEVLLRKALALAPDVPEVEYRAGETYELLRQRSKAISLVAMALARGYHTVEFQRSPELASLRADPAFQAALNQAKSETSLDKSKQLQ